MVRRLIYWSLDNRLIVLLMAVVLAAVGLYSLVKVNIEAYPDPAPAIIEVIAKFPGASAEEVERQVTIPLEVALAGMPGLKYTRSKSLFGLAHLRNQFEYGIPYERARQEVLNRLAMADLPPEVSPTLSPTSPTGEIYRYVIVNPRDAAGRDVYALRDLKSLQEGTLEKEFRRIPRIADVVSFGGEVKRYEVQPDPDRLRQYEITLAQLQEAIANSNANAGGDYVRRGATVQAVRGLGLIGGGGDPMQQAFAAATPSAAQSILRRGEEMRLEQIRRIVLSATDNVPLLVGNICSTSIDCRNGTESTDGVVIGRHTRMGSVSASLRVPRAGAHGDAEEWLELEDTVQGIVMLRKGEQSLPALADVKAKVDEISRTPGSLLPGVQLATFYDRTKLVHLTTETVKENVLLGLGLVTLILLVFLNNVRSALIVALNIPLALFFAFAALHFRGKSANLLSLGAVDFGIIADSSIIIVESIYRLITSTEHGEMGLNDRIKLAASGVERSLFCATLIMVCAMLPLFVMQGPEGQIFGPMADTYAFALGGALLLSLTLSPVLCSYFFRRPKPARDNFLVRGIKGFYLWQLDRMLARPRLALSCFAVILVGSLSLLPFLGREFMPELEEGNIYVRSTFPVRVALEEVAEKSRVARRLFRDHPEVTGVVAQCGRPDDGTDPTGFYNAEFLVSLAPQEEWPKSELQSGWRKVLFGAKRRKSKQELIESMQEELAAHFVGVDWNFSQAIRDNVMEILSGVKGENSLKIIGPDLDELEKLAEQVKLTLASVPGIKEVGVFAIKGQSNLEFAIDRDKCALWNVSVDDVQNVLQTAVGGKAFSQMVEGERKFDIALRWPEHLREHEDVILDIPVEVAKRHVSQQSSVAFDSGRGDTSDTVLPAGHTSPSLTGDVFSSYQTGDHIPRRRLRDLVVPLDEFGNPRADGSFVRTGASTIYREQGKRLVAIKFSVRGRDLASAVNEAQQKVAAIVPASYRTEWSGEFEQMQQAVSRLAAASAVAMALIVVLLYLTLRSVRDVLTVLSNVVVMSIGGLGALLLTGTNFNISAGVGFISVLGVGIMNGLLMVSAFNANRAHGQAVQEAIHSGVEKLVRPLTMTALAAIFGLLPAALSTRIGSESQRPLAIVVVGSMLVTLAMLNLVALLYSTYGHREPPEGAAGFAH
jgi:cobalt-zinc-cadmium resistance protein CzcA